MSNVEEIAKVPGVDVLFFGPGDFSILGGYPGQFDHPRIDEAMQKIAAAAKAAGIHWGMPIVSPKIGERVFELGGRFLANGCDQQMIRTGLEDLQKRFGAMGVTFDRRV